MKNILILLSTYNGHQFLREQLDSLYAQTGVEIHILVRDDGSKDNTVDILKEYQQNYGKMTILEGENVGAKQSFFNLIRYAVEHEEFQSDYYAFCDQDDQWMSEKLERAVSMLDTSKSDSKLYFCSANIVDANLNLLRASSGKIKSFDYTSSTFRNNALGCTMVFTFSLLQLCNRMSNHPMKLHDATMFQCANFFDADIYADKLPFINYRQHGNNVTSAYRGKIARFVGRIKLRVLNQKNGFLKSNESFYKEYGSDLTPDKKEFLQILINYKSSVAGTIKFLRVQKWRGCSKSDKFLWKIMVLFRLF